jgi:hypothetical protein
MNAIPNTDELLKNLAAEAAKQAENVRTAVRDVTLNALRGRELSLSQIKQVLKQVTAGVNAGAASAGADPTKVLEDAVAGMDDALLKAVEANRVALAQLASQGQSFRESHVKKALDDLEKLETDFLKTVKQTADRSQETLMAPWAKVLEQSQAAGTQSGAQVKAMMEQFAEQMQTAVRGQRRAAVEAAQVLSENFTTLASGILIGLSEGLQQGRDKPGAARKSP